jgi:transposase
MALAITRQARSAAELRKSAARSGNANAARGMLAIALVHEVYSRADTAERCGMDRQTLREWVHRCNAEGISGLVNRRALR